MKQQNKVSKRKIKVVEVDLTKQNNFAEVDTDTNLIYIHYTLRGRTRFRKLLHELLHISFLDASEKQILNAEKLIGNELWKQGYRWTDLKHK